MSAVLPPAKYHSILLCFVHPRPDILIRRLKKNKKQRDREKKKKLYITKLKNILIASDLVDANPKGTRQFTEVS